MRIPVWACGPLAVLKWDNNVGFAFLIRITATMPGRVLDRLFPELHCSRLPMRHPKHARLAHPQHSIDWGLIRLEMRNER
jgi:hypothetical protein